MLPVVVIITCIEAGMKAVSGEQIGELCHSVKEG